MSNDTPTPRTDWEFKRAGKVPTTFLKHARQLERELTAAQAEIAELRAKCERVISQWRAQSIRCGDDIIASNLLFECAHDLEREFTKTAKANPGGAHE